MVEQKRNSLEQSFMNFTGGKYEMDNKQFVKMCKDCQILDKKVTTTDCDISFTKYSNKLNKKCNYYQWQQVLEQFAQKKNMTSEKLFE